MLDSRLLLAVLFAALLGAAGSLAAGCGPTAGDDTQADGGRDALLLDAAADGWTWWPDGATSDAPVGFMGAVYAHRSSQLFKVDPDTFAVTLVGSFQWPGGSDQMTDIALDKDANMVGISFDTVYSVVKETAACARLAALDRQFNGLSFIPADEVSGGTEILVGTALDGSVYRIDKTTGASSLIGNFGGGMTSSGDIVSVTGYGTVATVKRGLGLTDWLARVDANTGVATVIGDTGFVDIWGLGFWRDRIYGFTEAGEFIFIDKATGAGQIEKTGSVAWWGAGVTTSAPYID